MQVPKNMLMPQNRCLLVKPFISRLGDLPALVNILHTGRNNNSKGNHQAKYFPCLAPIEEARAAKCAEPEVRAYREMRSPRVGPDTVSGVSCSITWLPSYTWTEQDVKTWWDWLALNLELSMLSSNKNNWSPSPLEVISCVPFVGKLACVYTRPKNNKVIQRRHRRRQLWK